MDGVWGGSKRQAAEKSNRSLVSDYAPIRIYIGLPGRRGRGALGNKIPALARPSRSATMEDTDPGKCGEALEQRLQDGHKGFSSHSRSSACTAREVAWM